MANYQPYEVAETAKRAASDGTATAAGGGAFATLAVVALGVLRSNGKIEIDDQTATIAVGAITSLGAAVVSGWKRWRRNRRKHKG
jgi:hypothetical protein